MCMMKKIISVLIPICANSWYSHLGRSWPSICENTSLTFGYEYADISLSPSIAEFVAWKDSSGIFSGLLQLDVDYSANSWDRTGSAMNNDIRQVVNVDNFASSKAGKEYGKGYFYHCCSYGRYRGSFSYNGDFATPIAGETYPFDEQTLTFKISIPKDYWGYWRGLGLFCRYKNPSGVCTAYGQDGQPLPSTDPYWTWPKTQTHVNLSRIVYKTVLEMNVKAKGFTWDKLVCELQKPYMYDPSIPAVGTMPSYRCPVTTEIHCSVNAKRDGSAVIIQRVVPGFFVMAMGFLSFCFPQGMAMPRVATSMIAMLTFNGIMIATLPSFPKTGTNVVFIFFILGFTCLFCNLVGQIMSFRFPAVGDIIGDFMGCVVAPLFFLILMSFMHTKTYPDFPSGGLTTFLVVLATICFIMGLICFIFQRRKELLNCRTLCKKSKEKVDDPDEDVASI